METILLQAVPHLGRKLQYRLVVSRGEAGAEYGLSVEYGTEQRVIGRLTPSRQAAEELAAALVRGRVTPVAFPDVIEDWLAR